MRTFQYQKLLRDKIIDDIAKEGGRAKYKVLSKKQYISHLQRKLGEESLELTSLTSPTDIVKELVDIQEIIDCLLQALKVSKTSLTSMQKQKNLKKGSFKKMRYIYSAQVPDSSEWISYLLKNPDRYPEIKL